MTRDGTISGERPCSSARGSRAANSAKQSEEHNRYQESNRSSWVADGVFDDRREGLGGGQSIEAGDVVHNEAEGNENEEAGESVDTNGDNHCFRDLSGGFLDFFAHAVQGRKVRSIRAL